MLFKKLTSLVAIREAAGCKLGVNMMDDNTSRINNTSSSYHRIQNDEQEINGIIVDLRQIIDHYSTTFARAGDIILRLARRLDETKQCEQGQICKRIKEILKDELKKGKISEKWIEKCLPKEYKRNYVKSELSSLSNSPEKILVSSQGKTITEPKAEPANDNIKIKNLSTCRNCELLQTENLQLAQALESKTQPITAEKLLENGERKFIILKRHGSEIINALQKCTNGCNLVFNSDGILIRIEPDNFEESDEEEGI
jgi:hypothetical protein